MKWDNVIKPMSVSDYNQGNIIKKDHLKQLFEAFPTPTDYVAVYETYKNGEDNNHRHGNDSNHDSGHDNTD